MENPFDIVIYFLPAVIAGIIIYFKYKRNNLRGRNFFANGTPVKLTKRVEVESFISRDEFIAANQQLLGKTGWGKWMKWIYIFIIGCAVLNLLTTPFFIKDYKMDYTSLIAPVFIFLFCGWAIFFASKKSAGKVYDATVFAKNKAHYVFEADYYSVDAGVTKTQSGWETINGYMETDTQLLIFTGPIQALFINKGNFAPGDLDTMRQFLAANFDVKKGLYS